MLLKTNIFDVYAAKSLIKQVKLCDIDKITFVKQGLSFGYFIFGFNVIFAFLRGFKLFGTLLLVAEIMLASLCSKVSFSYAIFSQMCFCFFVVNLAPEIEEFFVKKSGKILITHIIAKNLSSAQEDFFINFYPQYLEFLKKQSRLMFFSAGQNFYYNYNTRKINELRKSGFFGEIKKNFTTFYEKITKS